MSRAMAIYDLRQALKDEGFELPRDCMDVQLLAPTDGIFTLKYTVALTGEDLQKLGRALVRMGDRT